MLNWLIGFWDRRNRRTDIRILWPICLDLAPDLDHAKAAFFYYITNDPSWTDHYTHEELRSFVDALTGVK